MKILSHLTLVVIILMMYACANKPSRNNIVKSDSNGNVRPNVLLISVDDLNDWIGVLGGHPQTRTPNIDKLADRGVLFTNAHSQGTMCNPSRISIMFGLRPSSTGFYSNNYSVDKKPEFLNKHISLPKYFKNNDYITMTAGKVYHASWLPENEFEIIGPRPQHWSKYDSVVNKKPEEYHKIWDFGPQTYDDKNFVDYEIASWGASMLSQKYEKPFFCAIGFMRPHVPFFSPQHIYDQFNGAKLPDVLEDDWNDISPAAKALVMTNEKIPSHEWMMQEGKWEQAVQSYLSSVNWVDEQIGKVLEALEKSPNYNNTIVILYSDHGYHLGEKQRWSKFSLWERTTRVPFIISMPRIKSVSSKPVELLSIYPTLLDICGLTPNQEIEGVSLKLLLKNSNATWKHMAISTLGQNNHAIRSEKWRYIRYADGSEELYDHRADPNEWKNLINENIDAFHAKIVTDHRVNIPKVNKAQLGE